MDKEFDKRLDDFIQRFDDNIIDIQGEEASITLQELDYEAFQEWKELFEEYKRLKDNSVTNTFTDNFYLFTKQKIVLI